MVPPTPTPTQAVPAQAVPATRLPLEAVWVGKHEVSVGLHQSDGCSRSTSYNHLDGLLSLELTSNGGARLALTVEASSGIFGHDGKGGNSRHHVGPITCLWTGNIRARNNGVHGAVTWVGASKAGAGGSRAPSAPPEACRLADTAVASPNQRMTWSCEATTRSNGTSAPSRVTQCVLAGSVPSLVRSVLGDNNSLPMASPRGAWVSVTVERDGTVVAGGNSRTVRIGQD